MGVLHLSRKLDAAIAEALGNRVVYSENDCDWLAWDGDSDSDWIVPRYSTDGNAMFELDREMWKRGYELLMWFTGDKTERWYSVEYALMEKVEEYVENNVTPDVACHEETEPLARAMAAYLALTGKEWEEKS